MTSLLPLPAESELGSGWLTIDEDFKFGLLGSSGPRLRRAAERAARRLAKITGIPVSRDPATDLRDAGFAICVEEPAERVPSLDDDESYTLEITHQRAILQSPGLYGALHGIETFLQLVTLGRDGFGVPEIRISDRPRFPWRGLLIDACRHWIPPEIIKRNLDGMAMVKLNVLHWHLSNDQGFRMESRRFPRLHELGSDGMFYTQQEISEIVEFAHDRGIRVVPELDMPAHTTSWFVGYPELASAPGPYRLERKWGGHDPTIDPTKEASYAFIHDLMVEVSSIFSDCHIHIGGDQVSGKHWQANQEIRAFAQKQGFTDKRQIFFMFNRRIHEILRRLGKTMIGWDPILHPDLAQDSVVQSVRGQQWLADAARQGFRVVSGSQYYLDLLEPAEKYYTRDPFADEAADLTAEEQRLILGGEASMWTEFADADNFDARIWPRAAAVAERLWSPREVGDVDDMYRRLGIVRQRLAWTGLTHESGPTQMLRRLTDYRPTDSLSTLLTAVRPLFDPRWNNDTYTSLTPLNRLVDAAQPDSEIAREFALTVDRYVADPSNEDLHDALAARLAVWRDNHHALIHCIRHSQLLAEVEPVSSVLSRIAEVGLRSLRAMRSGSPISTSDREQDLTLLEGAAFPDAELEVSILPSIRSLLSAAPTD